MLGLMDNDFGFWSSSWVEGLGSRGLEQVNQSSDLVFRVQGSGFRVPGSGFKFQVSGFKFQVSGFMGTGFRVQGSGFRTKGVGCAPGGGSPPLPPRRHRLNHFPSIN